MIKTYVITWKNVVDGLPPILNQISNYEVINSDAPEKDGWHNLGLIWYYNQVKYALNHFINKTDDDIFCFITGDISSNSFQDIYNKASDLMKINEVGLYSPNLTNEPWTKAVCYMGNYDFDNTCYVSNQTEGIFFFMKRDIAKEMHLFMESLAKNFDLYSMRSGWGLDYVWCAICLLNNKIIIRDNQYFVHHPPGSSYDHSIAKIEKKQITDFFINNFFNEKTKQIIDFFNTLDERISNNLVI